MWQLFLHLSADYLVCMTVWLCLLAVCPVLLVRLRRRLGKDPKKRKWIFIGLSGWMCLACLTAAELGFALLYDTTDSFSMTNCSRRWFDVHVTPDLKTLEFSNGTGIEYRDTQQVPRPGLRNTWGRHVCLLGDSFTFGHGVAVVQDRFSNRLQALLNRSHTQPDGTASCVVSNLSQPGTDLYWVESVLQNMFRDDYQIDDVVYVMCLNDIEAFHDPTMSESINQARFEPPTVLLRETYFLNWAWFRFQQASQSSGRDYYGFVEGLYAGQPWHRFRTRLRSVQRLCVRNGCSFSVVVFPFLHSSRGDRFDPVRRKITAACRQDGIVAIDLEEAFHGQRAEQLTVNAFDAHPNERAHQLVAEFLAPKLKPDATPLDP
ncbi:MAG: SGNH/GDSL hydrolase family protein [Planctomycetaceae bacterium]